MAIAASTRAPAFALCAGLLTVGAAHAGQYSLDGFVLGERIAPTNPNYQTYTCKPSEDFDEAIRCEINERPANVEWLPKDAPSPTAVCRDLGPGPAGRGRP